MNKKKILTMGCLSVALCACCAFGIRYAVQADKQGVQESYPLIEVDYCGAEEIPYAIVGNSYKVFEAKAIGEKTSQSFNLTTKVYYNYYSDTPINVNLENGEFVPKNEGVYTILYTAKSGTLVKDYEVDVTAYKQSPLQISLPAVESGYTIADVVTLDAPIVTENSGVYTLTANAVCGDKSYPLEKVGDAFSYKLMKAGTHAVEYTYSDYTQTVKKSVNLSVAVGTGYEIKEDSADPVYLVKNATYAFDSIVYYDKSESELVARTADMKYATDNGTETAYTVGNRLSISGSSSLTLSYYANGNKITQKTLGILDGNYGAGKVNVSSLFATKTGSFTRTDNGEYPIWTTSEDSTLAFANRLIMENFTLDLRFTKCGAGELKVILQDYYDKNNVLEVSIYPRTDGASSDVYVNGEYLVKANGYYPNGNVFNLRYLSGSNSLVVAGTTVNLDGYFKGMSWGCANLSVGVGKVSSETSLSIEAINSQPIKNTRITDNIEANTYTYTSGMYQTIGSVLEFYTQVADVYSPSVTATFSVRTPSGGYATSISGTELKDIPVTAAIYAVKLNEYGRYNISVSTNDGMENNRRKRR